MTFTTFISCVQHEQHRGNLEILLLTQKSTSMWSSSLLGPAICITVAGLTKQHTTRGYGSAWSCRRAGVGRTYKLAELQSATSKARRTPIIFLNMLSRVHVREHLREA